MAGDADEVRSETAEQADNSGETQPAENLDVSAADGASADETESSRRTSA